jgi:hypothetical protein
VKIRFGRESMAYIYIYIAENEWIDVGLYLLDGQMERWGLGWA